MPQCFDEPLSRETQYHIPIMPSQAANYLINKKDGLYIDCTFGGGGHTSHMLENFPDIKIIAFDWDARAFGRFKEKEKSFNGKVLFVRENFKNIKSALLNLGISKVDGIFADIGVSSRQFDDLSRGFSFNSQNLDMRMDLRNPLSAKDAVNSLSEEELADIFYKYGGEHRSRQIAFAIIKRRKRGNINSASELAEIVCSAKRREGKINPATKVFQALRIFTNGEIDSLKTLLSGAPDMLNAGGRIAVISFHSLEDGEVKRDFREKAASGVYKIITKKAVSPSNEEIKSNPRSRSAKIRAAEKI